MYFYVKVFDVLDGPVSIQGIVSMVLYPSNIWFPFKLKSVWIQSKLFSLSYLFILLVKVLKFYAEDKAAAFSFDGGEVYCAVELANNLVCNHESNADAVCVHGLLIHNEPK